MKAFIGYVSMSGNTEDIANILKETLLSKGYEVEIEYLDSMEPEKILTYDCILIGAYTWGNGDLPYEAEDFLEGLNSLDLDGIAAACFGSGERVYPEFCAAVDILADKLEERGSLLFQQRLKIELSPESEEQIAECQQFAQSFYSWLKEQTEK